MFRFHLAVIIVVSFVFVLILGIALYWVSNRVSRDIQSSRTAFDAFDRYQRLSQEAYLHFIQRIDRLGIMNPSGDSDPDTTGAALDRAVQKLRETAVNTAGPENPGDDRPDKRGELERVARFTAFLESSEYRFDEIERLHRQNKPEMAVQTLMKFSRDEIGGEFRSMVDEAIGSEREAVEKARLELQNLISQTRWIAITVSVIAAIFGLWFGLYLLGGFKKRMEALLKGTDEVASGHLDYRIQLAARDEFAYLAGQFNQMARELELQQNKLREGRSVLEQRVAARTFELNRLNDELQRMDSERREFLSDISHELRTPITVIRGEAEVTLRVADRDIEEYKDALQRILELSMQLGKYVKDLLFVARTEIASFQFEWENVDLVDLVMGSEENFQVMAGESSLSVSLNGPGQPVWVRGDRQRLKQVLFILVDNACCYSKPGGQIAVTLWVKEKEVGFSIADQGIGIPDEDLARIFDRHFRSPNARRSRADGRGLGLSMAKSIVKAHDGRISVTSTENSGSIFTVTLPLVSNDAEENSIE